MRGDILLGEIRSILKRAVFLDIAAYLISVIVCGASLSFALGLLLGTAVLLATLCLLKISVERMAADAKRSGVTSQRRYLLYYAMRLGVFGAAFGAAVILRKYISPVAVVIPMLYPRLIYTAGALLQGAGLSGQKRGEK
ncbi:MAG: ATP synthase subunit I [Oscillospiraceae bacterium]|nr:ATP synthase subunit I [Oscillospiraceae bacterium]